MKLKLAMAASLLLASMSGWGAATPGAGITGSAHDWSSPITVTVNNGVGTIGGGTSTTAYYALSGGNKVVASAADIAAGLSYITPVTQGGDGLTAYKIQNTSTTAPVLDASGLGVSTKIAIGQCTKCHTPHQAKSVNLLWNHTLNSGTYKWDDPTTTAGTTYASFKGDTYKGPSPKCLSCHDGTMASTDGMWFQRTARTGVASAYTSVGSGHVVTKGASTNMSGTHPVAMPYPLNNAASTYNLVTTGSDFIVGEWVDNPKTLGIRMFKDDGTGGITAGTAAGATGIECSSCHDVHNGKNVKDVYLLTGMSTGNASNGYICTQCHKK